MSELSGPCPTCGEVVNWPEMRPITKPAKPEHTLLGMPVSTPMTTGWWMTCGCRFDGWIVETAMDRQTASIRLKSPDGLTVHGVECQLEPMWCPTEERGGADG